MTKELVNQEAAKPLLVKPEKPGNLVKTDDPNRTQQGVKRNKSKFCFYFDLIRTFITDINSNNICLIIV